MSWITDMDEMNERKLMQVVSEHHDAAHTYGLMTTVISIVAAFIFVLLSFELEKGPGFDILLYLGGIVGCVLLAFFTLGASGKNSKKAKYGELLLNSRQSKIIRCSRVRSSRTEHEVRRRAF